MKKVKVKYLVNHHGSNGYRLAGFEEEVSDEVAKGLMDSETVELVKETKASKKAAERETKEDKEANQEETK